VNRNVVLLPGRLPVKSQRDATVSPALAGRRHHTPRNLELKLGLGPAFSYHLLRSLSVLALLGGCTHSRELSPCQLNGGVDTKDSLPSVLGGSNNACVPVRRCSFDSSTAKSRVEAKVLTNEELDPLNLKG